jgi:hypothetical protein
MVAFPEKSLILLCAIHVQYANNQVEIMDKTDFFLDLRLEKSLQNITFELPGHPVLSL